MSRVLQKSAKPAPRTYMPPLKARVMGPRPHCGRFFKGLVSSRILRFKLPVSWYHFMTELLMTILFAEGHEAEQMPRVHVTQSLVVVTTCE